MQSLGLSQSLLRTLSSLSITTPTPVQQSSIPPILQNKNILASAQTGSGKTSGFCMALLHCLSLDPYGVFALVLCPTRELAIQIGESFRILSGNNTVRVEVIVGGMDIATQANALAKRPHIIVATPGRLAHHLSFGNLQLNRLRFLVLDEADRLLADQFDQIQNIINMIGNFKQLLVYTATMTQQVEEWVEGKGRNPVKFGTGVQVEIVESLDQKYIFVPAHVKDVYLYKFLQSHSNKSVMIFGGSCKSCELLHWTLRTLDIRCTALHSHMSQKERTASLAKFKGGIVKVLVCTDVASRGLDIPQVECVVNFEVPANALDYVHRIGRTARAGKGGMSFTIVAENEIDRVLNIESKTNVKMTELIMNEEQVLTDLQKVTQAKRQAKLILYDRKFGEQQERNKKKERV